MLIPFAYFYLLLAFPFIALLTLCSTKDFFNKVIPQGEVPWRSIVFGGVTIGFAVWLSCLFIETGAGLPYDIRGNWIEKDGLLLEWEESPRYKHDATIQAAEDGTLKEYFVINMMHDTSNTVPAGFEVCFLIKGSGNDVIYITAYRQPGCSEWTEIPVRFPTPAAQAASYQTTIVILFLEVVAVLFYTVRRKGPPWRFPKWGMIGSLLLTGAFAAVGISSIYQVNAYAKGKENDEAVRWWFSAVGVLIVLTYLWVVALDLWRRRDKLPGKRFAKDK